MLGGIVLCVLGWLFLSEVCGFDPFPAGKILGVIATVGIWSIIAAGILTFVSVAGWVMNAVAS